MKKSTHTLPIFSKKSAILSLKKDMVELLVSQYEEVASKAIMFLKQQIRFRLPAATLFLPMARSRA